MQLQQPQMGLLPLKQQVLRYGLSRPQRQLLEAQQLRVIYQPLASWLALLKDLLQPTASYALRPPLLDRRLEIV
jgi:hypothetical protein